MEIYQEAVNAPGPVSMTERFQHYCRYAFNIIVGMYVYLIDCGYSLEPPWRGGSKRVPTTYVLSENKKQFQKFSIENF